MTIEGIILTTADIDEARKQCQRLCDKAVSQYKKAKDMKEIGMLKEYEDQKWREKFSYHYDYEDDEENQKY